MPRWLATRARTAPVEILPPPAMSYADVPPSRDDRRVRAFERVYPLLPTSIPTAQILAAYEREIAEP